MTRKAYLCYNVSVYGEVLKWLKRAVLKTASVRKGSVGSNPTLSAIILPRKSSCAMGFAQLLFLCLLCVWVLPCVYGYFQEKTWVMV